MALTAFKKFILSGMTAAEFDKLFPEEKNGPQ